MNFLKYTNVYVKKKKENTIFSRECYTLHLMFHQIRITVVTQVKLSEYCFIMIKRFFLG